MRRKLGLGRKLRRGPPVLAVAALSLAFLAPDFGRPFLDSLLLQPLVAGENEAPSPEEDTQHESSREGGEALNRERGPNRKTRHSGLFLRLLPSGFNPEAGPHHPGSARPNRLRGRGNGLGVPLRC